MKTVTKTAVAGLLVVVAVAMAGCSGQPLTTREKGVGIGALVGAGTGAIIGSAVGHPGAGAAIGGGIGALGGGLIGNELQNREIEERHMRRRLASQQRQLNHQRRGIQQLQRDQET